MRDYLTVKTGVIPKIGYVYEAFKSYVMSDKSLTIKMIVEDIYKFSSYYVNMVLHKEPDMQLKVSFKRISQLKVDVCYPFLLAIYNDYSNQKIDNIDFIEIISLVENYVFRRSICSIPTNSLNKTFATFYKNLDMANYLASVKAKFILLDSYKRFPNNSEFFKSFIIKDIYNSRNRNYLLDRLENFNRKEKVSIDEYTIEHILPQNKNLSNDWISMLGEEWKETQTQYLHTIGNLTLTGYNSELSDKPFIEKKSMNGGFDDSPIRLNDFLKKINYWNEETIINRAEILANIALSIWFFPDLEADVLEQFKPVPQVETTYSLDHYEYLNGQVREMYDLLSKRILNIDSSVREEFKKLYIAYKSDTNFIDIVPQKSGLRLTLNIKFSDLHDPKSLCRDVTGLGRWGNGDVEFKMENVEQIEDIMYLIVQSFEMQIN